jgi:competence protein ComEC
MKKISLICFIVVMLLTLCRSVSVEIPTELIIWNIGQGQWVTLRNETTCLHFDMGGEFAPWREIKKACAQKVNRVYFSHWDQDHIGFAKKAAGLLNHLCIAAEPGGQSPTAKKTALLAALPRCYDLQLHKVGANVFEVTEPLEKTKNAKANDFSRVYVVHHSILIPGDSPSQQEKNWAHRIPSPEKIQILILGHHGSRTSTSHFLLDYVSQLKTAIASARFSRYGHPHLETIQRLRAHHVEILRTEDWHTLHLEVTD